MLTTTVDRGPRVTSIHDGSLRPLLLAALRQDAVDDAVTEMLFDHVVLGRYHWTVVANSLPLLLGEALDVALPSDWVAAGYHLLDSDGEAEDRGTDDDVPGQRRSEAGTVFDAVLIRTFLCAVADEVGAGREPDLRAGLAAATDIGFGACAVGAITEEALRGLLGAATEEDWNIIAGQLIAEAREVCGPVHAGKGAS
jgi:hypothetical protein